jgi:imidazole glycerol-phosphate synthase subunit HisH
VSPLVSQPVEIAILDYGMGNRRSVEKALAHVGAQPLVTRDPELMASAAGLIVPGVGAFPRAMENLGEFGLIEPLRERVAQGRPTLGICLGMQLAFGSSDEMGGATGLGIVPGEVTPLRTEGLKLPHIGWNEVTLRQPGSPLLRDLPDGCAFYHVHSYAARPQDQADVLGTAEYGETFVTAVQRGSFYGVQFHPEKSSAAGLRLLGNFAQVCLDALSPAATLTP